MFQFSSGTILGRYELLVPVARGGMADVWAARLHGTRGFTKLVAIKTIRTGSLDDARLEQMLMAEAQLASQIQHPNVVSTLELGEQDETLFLVMEWADSEPLSFLLKEPVEPGSIPIRIAVNIIAQACRGADCAHQLVDADGNPLGVVHRDLSPQNVLVTYMGIVKLVDFGIAKATQQASSMTEDGEVKGKLAYMSPEQVRGEAVDRRTDVFALGTMLYLLTTGQHPFKCTHPGETMAKLVSDVPVLPPSRVLPDYPPELQAVVLKALHKDRDQRFETADAMMLALEAAVPEAKGIDAEVAKFLRELSAGRGEQRRRHIRTAGELLDRVQDGLPSHSSTSLSAFSMATTGAQSTSSLRQAVAAPVIQVGFRHWATKPWAIAGASLVVVAVGVSATLLGSDGNGGATSASNEASQPAPTALASAVPGASTEWTARLVPDAPKTSASKTEAPKTDAGTRAFPAERTPPPRGAQRRVRSPATRQSAEQAAEETQHSSAATSAAAEETSVAPAAAAPTAEQAPSGARPRKSTSKGKKKDSWDPTTFGGRL